VASVCKLGGGCHPRRRRCRRCPYFFSCCCCFAAAVVVLALSCFNGRISASFCHMSNLIANLINEKPAAARRLNKIWQKIVQASCCRRLFHQLNWLLNSTCDKGFVGSSVDDFSTRSCAVGFISLLRLLPLCYVVIVAMMSAGKVQIYRVTSAKLKPDWLVADMMNRRHSYFPILLVC
jgi:hypothetical protein